MALFKILSRSYRRYDRNRRFDWAPIHALTLTTWFNGQHASIDQHLIGMPIMGYRLFLRSLGNYSYLSANLGIQTITNPDPILKNTWTHAAIVWTGEKLKLFNNGEVIFTKNVNNIRYMEELYGASIWAFENTIGGNSYQLGLNLFTMWGSALTNSEIEYLAEGGNPTDIQYEGIRLGDFLDEANSSGIFGDFIPDQVTNQNIIDIPSSPFSEGIVPYPVPEIFISSSSSSESSESSISSLSTSLTSESSPSSLSTLSEIISESSISTSSSSGEGLIFEPGTYSWVVPNNVFLLDKVKAWAGGGGGGGSLNRQSYVYFVTGSGGGGGGGAYNEIENVAVTPGETLTIVVGHKGIAGKSFITDLLQTCGVNPPTPGSDGETTYLKRGSTDLIRIEGGKGGGEGYTTNIFQTSPRGGSSGNGGNSITPSGGINGENGNKGIPYQRAFFWPPNQLGGTGGDSGSPPYGKGGDGANSNNSCEGGIVVPEDGGDGRMVITFTVEQSSSSSSISSISSSSSTSSSSPDESKSSTSSSTGSTNSESSSESSAG